MQKIKYVLASAVSGLTLLFGASSAMASGDAGCVPYMPTLSSHFSCDVLGTLSPENDTRDNLIFLMADRQKQALAVFPEKPAVNEGDDYISGEGSVCVSDQTGSVAFLAAVAADSSLSEDEKKQLQAARQAVKCSSSDGASGTVQPLNLASASGKAFAAYVAAVSQFYGSSTYDPAPFNALADSEQVWVREAARYMQARIALLMAQADVYDDYGTLDRARIDKAKVSAAHDALNKYLKDYPHGVYAASATGLLRRADWLSGDAATLAATYSKLVTSRPVDLVAVDIANELDIKLPVESYTNAAADPMLLAVQDLRLMRKSYDNDNKLVYGIKAEELEAQRSQFAGQEKLFDYLVAFRAFAIDKDAGKVLSLVQEAAPEGELDYTAFSRLMLRAAALDAKGDTSARALYVAMLPQAKRVYQHVTLELALAKYDERHKNISAAFEDGSPIQDPEIRKILLDQVAGPIILKMQGTSEKVPQAERDVALYRLFTRDMTQGRFKGFLDDIKLLPAKPAPNADGDVEDVFVAFRWEGGDDDGYACPGVVDIAKVLAANAKDVKGRLCLGDFFRVNYVDPIEPVDKDALGGTGTLFAGKVLARHDFYLDIMTDKKASRTDRAYALFRALHCYQPVGHNSCGGTDAAKAQRKAWFNELKAKYGDTVWGKNSKYYW